MDARERSSHMIRFHAAMLLFGFVSFAYWGSLMCAFILTFNPALLVVAPRDAVGAMTSYPAMVVTSLLLAYQQDSDTVDWEYTVPVYGDVVWLIFVLMLPFAPTPIDVGYPRLGMAMQIALVLSFYISTCVRLWKAYPAYATPKMIAAGAGGAMVIAIASLATGPF